jgi:hypothetical protein
MPLFPTGDPLISSSLLNWDPLEHVCSRSIQWEREQENPRVLFCLFVCLLGFFFKGQVSVGSLHFHLILFGPELGPTTST